jgi:hypothetical protein
MGAMKSRVAIVFAVIGALSIIGAGFTAVTAISARQHISDPGAPLVANFCSFLCVGGVLIGTIAIAIAISLKRPAKLNGDE